jgi:ribonuclease BN (tRNA processing enzyme)
MATELILLGTAGAPMPVVGRRGISSVLVVGERVFVIDCGRGSPSAFAEAGLDFARLEAVFITHLHADHVGDLPGMILYPWGVRVAKNGPLSPIRVYGPPRPRALPAGDAVFHRQTVISPGLPAPGTADLVGHILAGYAYHLNVMPVDCHMPDAGALVRGIDVVAVVAGAGDTAPDPVVVIDDAEVLVTAVAVTHGRAVPALAYRFDTADGSVVFSGDTSVNESLIALALGADVLVHQVADLGYLRRHGMDDAEVARMAAPHTDVTEVGSVAERAGVRELILNHYLPAEPDAITEAEWARRAGNGFSGRTTAGHDSLRRTLSATAA